MRPNIRRPILTDEYLMAMRLRDLEQPGWVESWLCLTSWTGIGVALGLFWWWVWTIIFA